MYTYIHDRIDFMKSLINRDNSVLEIGPGFVPICKKSDFKAVYYVDSLTDEELKERAKSTYGYDANQVESDLVKIDIQFNGTLLSSVIEQKPSILGDIDIIVGSHTAEHSPDFLGFLKDASNIIKADGAVFLALPDSRATFDYYRPLTSIGEIFDRHVNKTKYITLSNYIDNHLYASQVDGFGAWAYEDSGKVKINHLDSSGLIESCVKDFDKCIKNEKYIDAHVTVFTPEWFQLLMIDLYLNGLVDLVPSFIIGHRNEFFVMLNKANKYALEKNYFLHYKNILLDRIRK